MTLMTTRHPRKLSIWAIPALSVWALAAALPTGAAAQAKDPALVTCAELMAMQAEEQMTFVKALVAASADADDLNDLATSGDLGPMIEICTANPEMMAMDAAKQLGN